MQRSTVTLFAVLVLTGCAADSTHHRDTHRIDPQAILSKTWQWESTTSPIEKITVPEPENFTILLGVDGRAQIRFDCNRGGGEFEIAPGKLSFGPLLSTRMGCPPESLDSVFTRDLQRVASFFVSQGRLYLELPCDSGTMQFSPAE